MAAFPYGAQAGSRLYIPQCGDHSQASLWGSLTVIRYTSRSVYEHSATGTHTCYIKYKQARSLQPAPAPGFAPYSQQLRQWPQGEPMSVLCCLFSNTNVSRRRATHTSIGLASTALIMAATATAMVAKRMAGV